MVATDEALVAAPQRTESRYGFVQAAPALRERNANGGVVGGRRAGADRHHEPTTTEKDEGGERLASTTGPRTTGSATVVASVSPSASERTAAKAVAPSSHGTSNSRWSLAASIEKPHSTARFGVAV